MTTPRRKPHAASPKTDDTDAMKRRIDDMEAAILELEKRIDHIVGYLGTRGYGPT